MTYAGLPSIAFVALVLATGVYQGLRNERWHASTDVDDAVSRLEKVPMTVGSWKGEPQKLEVGDLTHLGIKGHVLNRYRNVMTGDVLSALIVCGRPGPISVHTPDICYGTAGYTAASDIREKTVPIDGGRNLSVWAQSFKRPAAQTASQIEVNWVWMAGNNWVAAENSRLAFAGFPALYKLYVVRDLPALESSQKNDPSVSFLRVFLPALEKVLAPAQSP